MFKKKEQLYECFKKNGEAIIFHYLDESSLLNLAVCSKKYYLLVNPFLTALGLDEQKKDSTQKGRSEAKKTKKKKKDEQKGEILEKEQTTVDIVKATVNKCKEDLSDEKWVRITQLPYSNDYLQDKLSSGALFFYKNQTTNKIAFINRSLVDPNLNYNRGGFNSDMEDQRKTNLYAQMFEGEISQLDFSSPEALRLRHKQMLEKINKKKEEVAKMDLIDYELEFVKGVTAKKIAIILCFGGSFSFGIFQDGKCINHKSDKKYVVRGKAGERQFNKDKQSGTQIQSIGSQIRRDQQKKHVINVGIILNENKKAIESCELVFLQAPGLNRLFIINDSETLSGVKNRLRSVCLTAKKANYTEVEAIYNEIIKVNFATIKQKVIQKN